MSTLARALSKDVCYEDSLCLALRDPAEAAAYLTEVIAMQDQRALLLAIRHVVKTHDMAVIARRAQLGDKAVFRELSDSGSPTLETFNKVLNSIGLRLSVEAVSA
jgi:probable addiction module antidote protein